MKNIQRKAIMSAEEYRKHRGIGSGTNITTEMLEEFAVSYHQHNLSEITEEEIDKLWYKFADTENDFGNLFLGRDSYDLLMDELTNLLKGEI